MRTQGAEETISPAPCGYFCRLKLHYSQTLQREGVGGVEFNYHLKLHYSQTVCDVPYSTLKFNYHLKYTTLKHSLSRRYSLLSLTTT